jgi:hypothetical protein
VIVQTLFYTNSVPLTGLRVETELAPAATEIRYLYKRDRMHYRDGAFQRMAEAEE